MPKPLNDGGAAGSKNKYHGRRRKRPRNGSPPGLESADPFISLIKEMIDEERAERKAERDEREAREKQERDERVLREAADRAHMLEMLKAIAGK